MTRTNKIILGVLTFLPIFFVIGYFIIALISLSHLPHGGMETLDEDPSKFVGSLFFGGLFIFLGVLIGLGLMVYYLIHAARNAQLSETERVVWIVVLVIASGLASIVYYFMNIVPLPDPSSKEATS